jgi:PAS domain S-box-containing protein
MRVLPTGVDSFGARQSMSGVPPVGPGASRARSEARYRALLEGLTEAYALEEALWDGTGRPHDFRFLEVNAAWERMMGLRREAVLGRTIRELFPANAERWCELCARVVSTGEASRLVDRDSAGDREFEVTLFRPFDGSVACVFFDSTPRARAERELRESEEKYRRIVEATHEGVWLIDAEERTTFVNRRVEEILGYLPGEMLGRSLFSFLPEEALADVGRRLEHHRQGVSETFERKFRRKDGSVVWTLLSTSPLPALDGSYSGALAMVTDISQIKSAEAEREEAQELFQILAGASSEGIAVSEAGVVIACNGRLEEMHGYAHGELAGRRLEELIAEESRPALRAHVASGVARRLEYTALRKDGSRFSVSGEGREGTYRGRQVRITVARDLTGEEKARAEIARMNRLYTALIGISSTAFRVRSPGELFRAVCRVLVERGGFKMAWVGWHDVASHQVLVVGSHGDETGFLEEVRVFADERPEGTGPTGISIRDGRAVICNDYLEDARTVPWRDAAIRASWRSSAAFPVRVDGESRGALTVYSSDVGFFGDGEAALLEEAAADISHALANLGRETLRKRAEDEIRSLNAELERRVKERTRELEEAVQQLDAFSYSVSHDLRAPLRAIEGFSARVVEKAPEQFDDESRRLLGVVRSNAQRMARLIDDLLTFSRSGRKELAFGLVDMGKLAHSAFEEVAGGVERRDSIDFRLGPLPEVRGDEALLRQVWVNLISNAVKFSAKREGAVVEVTGSVEGARSVYRVRDNGAGFDMAYADKLFGVFQRLHGMTEFEGTGVGLALVHRIVARHGGKVEAWGEVGTGACFSFALPTLSPPP